MHAKILARDCNPLRKSNEPLSAQLRIRSKESRFPASAQRNTKTLTPNQAASPAKILSITFFSVRHYLFLSTQKITRALKGSCSRGPFLIEALSQAYAIFRTDKHFDQSARITKHNGRERIGELFRRARAEKYLFQWPHARAPLW